jgi:hypothetical protein
MIQIDPFYFKIKGGKIFEIPHCVRNDNSSLLSGFWAGGSAACPKSRSLTRKCHSEWNEVE